MPLPDGRDRSVHRWSEPPRRRPLVEWLDYNAFAVVTKPARAFIDGSGRKRLRGDVRVEIVDRRRQAPLPRFIDAEADAGA